MTSHQWDGTNRCSGCGLKRHNVKTAVDCSLRLLGAPEAGQARRSNRSGMSAEELQDLAVRALCIAHAKRYEGAEGADHDQMARAWERLADAADALHAILTRQEAWDSVSEPPHGDDCTGGGEGCRRLR